MDAVGGSTTLYFGPWYRRSPYFEATIRAGCTAFDIYNHTYLPAYYGDPVEEYDLTRCAVGQGKYAPLLSAEGGIINDPVLLRVAADRFWLCLADSDAGLWARGVALGAGMDVTIGEPPVYPLQIQGPKATALVRDLFGEPLAGLRYYFCTEVSLDGIPVVVSRTGWTGEVGYEVFLQDPSRGSELWDKIMASGERYQIRPIAPCEARRIEAGIFNYNSDMTIENNPLEITGMERLVEPQQADYIGRAALERVRANGVRRVATREHLMRTECAHLQASSPRSDATGARSERRISGAARTARWSTAPPSATRWADSG